MSDLYQIKTNQLEARIAELTDKLNETLAERDKTKLLYEISTELNTAPDFDSIASAAINFAGRIGATSGEVYLMTDNGQTYIRSTSLERNILENGDQHAFIHRLFTEGLEGWVLKNNQSALILDTQIDDRWLPLEHPINDTSIGSVICSPIIAKQSRLKGVISFFHPKTNQFDEQDLALLDVLASQTSVALEKTTLLEDLQHSLQKTNLIANASQQLVAATNLEDVYAALVRSITIIGAKRCVLYICDDFDANGMPKYARVVYVHDADSTISDEENVGNRFLLAQYPILDQAVQTHETLIISDVATNEYLDQVDRQFLSTFEVKSVAIIPLVSRSRVIGLLFIQYRKPHDFDDRELALYHTICNQSIVAIENARQRQLTEMALAETQTLYRAGRVLAGTTNLEDILQESLFEFLYSLNLDQGGITLLAPDRQLGELVAYVQNGKIQEVQSLKFSIDEAIPYQQILLSGRPFQSYDVLNDPRLKDFQHFNKEEKIKSLLQAPMIIHGETIGWVGADSVKQHREFSQREIDLARAMADQIAITIQNRRLLEKSERQAEQLKAVAQVGKSVAQLIELDEILSNTVDLIRDQFGFYHVSIFLLDEADEWAVVRASTGEVGKIMVKRPHRLKVGGRSIVGYVTANSKPRIALDVGEDRVHFNNPLLPNTRSEMALPMIARGNVIGALDVQSIEANAFDEDDVETLQIMADQLTAAIENAGLFKQTEKNLRQTQSLYRVGEALAASTDLQTTFEAVLGEYLSLLNLKQGSLMLFDRAENANKARARYIDSRPAEPYLVLPIEDDLVFQHLRKNPTALVIDSTQDHPLVKTSAKTRGQFQAQSMLFIPLLAQGELVGSIVVDSIEANHAFSHNDIKTGEIIADQLSIWLENRQLLEEAQHGSNLLQTAAEVSRAASSILDTDQLINTAVNLIRDKFDFYYVGLFLIDEASEWAVLRAGTGEAGRLQIENNHQLRIGGGSMIGWSVENRKARIALDVGEEETHFKRNKYLPDTRSEMALPLISRDEVIGALTVQSIKRSAFSDEDITLLQTMADQLANAIANAHLFESVARSRKDAEDRLQETTALQQLSQQLASTLQINEIIDIFLRECTKGIGFDYIQFSLVDREQRRIKAVGGVGVTETHIKRANRSLDSNDIMADIIRTGKTEIFSGWDNRFHEETYEAEEHADWVRVFTPITLRQENIGLVEAGFNKIKHHKIKDAQLRLLRAFIDQTVLALENAQRYEISRRAAQREEIIREITGKIRNAVSIDDILKTTVTELSKVVGASEGGITLDVSHKISVGSATPANGSSDNKT